MNVELIYRGHYDDANLHNEIEYLKTSLSNVVGSSK